MRRKLLIIVSTAILIVVALILIKNNAKADFAGELLNQKRFSLNLDGQDHNFEIKIYKEEADFRSYLIEEKPFSSQFIELNGFEDNIELCQGNPVKIGNDIGEAICLISDVGAHSQNLMIIKHKEGKFDNINIDSSDGNGKNITSDVPNMVLKDYNNDGVIDLMVDNRNYDLDPVSNAVRGYFTGSERGFVFDRNEGITYN